MVEIIPGIFENDLADIIFKLNLVTPYVNTIQIDISDGTLVDKITPYKAELYKPVLSLYKDHIFEAHLMVDRPENFITPFADAGFKRLVAHVEAIDPRLFIEESLYESVDTGIAIDAPTDFEIIEPFLDEIDFVLVMTAPAGASGQAFMPETLERVRLIHQNYPDLPIEVDCGINDRTARIAKDAGATRLVSTSYIFKDIKNIQNSIETLKKVSGINIEMDIS